MPLLKGLIVALFLFLVAEGALGQNLVSLYYDDGESEDGVWINDIRGHSILFTAPSDNWSLSGVAIFGKRTLDSRSELFVVEVWDENLALLSRTTDRSASYFTGEFGWALVDLPDVQVSRNFFINFYEFAGVYVGIDQSGASGRSLISARNPNRIMEWSVASHQQNQTNWMMRALGYSPEPQIRLNVTKAVASPGEPAVIDLEARDPDGNLKNAALYVISNESKEIVWSEVKPLEGFEADAQFSWPGKVVQISNSSFSVAPVFATNNVDTPENLSSCLAYSAPCILQLEPKSPSISAIAYFGDDGKLNALIDVLGQSHYFSKDLLNAIAPDINYMNYVGKNIALKKDVSMITFLKMASGTDGQILVSYPPIALSKTALFNFGITLEMGEADPGEYLAVMVVEDWAFNSVGAAGNQNVVKL